MYKRFIHYTFIRTLSETKIQFIHFEVVNEVKNKKNIFKIKDRTKPYADIFWLNVILTRAELKLNKKRVQVTPFKGDWQQG